MARIRSSEPTRSELEILTILWARGPSTVREVHDVIGAERSTGYTGTLKLLQIMTEKGLVRRNEKARAHVYEAKQPAEKTKRRIVDDIVEKMFGGSASQLIMHALQSKPASPEELEAIRRLLDEQEEKRR